MNSGFAPPHKGDVSSVPAADILTVSGLCDSIMYLGWSGRYYLYCMCAFACRFWCACSVSVSVGRRVVCSLGVCVLNVLGVVFGGSISKMCWVSVFYVF